MTKRHVPFRPLIASVAMALLALGVAPPTSAEVNAVTPSTNDINRTNGWAHVDQVAVGIGTTTLRLISMRPFASCFEYRTDGDTSQVIGAANFNPAVTDGLYPYTCRNNNTIDIPFSADAYVEVRMVFGAESDERFDWTRFDVLPDAQTKDDCKDGGWADYGFANQGQCIRFIQTGKDSRQS